MPRRNYPKNRKQTLHLAPKTPHLAPTPDIACRQKRRFPTEKQARAEIEIKHLQQPNLNLETYACPSCRGWHLTSKKRSV